MTDEGAKQALFVLQGTGLPMGGPGELFGFGECEVGEGIHFQVSPGILDRIQFGGVGRQERRCGSVPSITAYKWVGTGGNAPSAPQFDLLFSGTDCSVVSDDNLCAIVNNAIIPGPLPWAYSAKQGPGGQYPIGAFYEGGIDATAFGLSECFNSFLAETRSSQSLDAVLKDLAGGPLTSCSISVTKASNVNLTKVGHNVHYTITITNTGGVTLYKDDINDTLVGALTTNGVDDLNGNGDALSLVTTCGVSLAPLASCTIQYDRTVVQTDPDPLNNTVTVSYNSKANFTGTAVNGTANKSVNLFTASVTVDKTVAPTLANIGDTVVYHYVITNTSSSDAPSLVLDSVSDDKLGDLTATASGAGCGTLASGGSCNFNVNHPVVNADFPSVTNTVTVHYHPTGFTNDIFNSDPATLHVRTALTLVTHVHNIDPNGDGNHADADHTTDIQGTTLNAPASVDDSATVGGMLNSVLPTNPVVFTFYRGSQCGSGAEAAGSINVTSIDGSGNFIAHPSSEENTLGGNTYSFRASIASDDNYDGKTSTCEPFFVRTLMPLRKHSTSSTPPPNGGFTFGLFPGPAVASPHAPAGYDPTDNTTDTDGLPCFAPGGNVDDGVRGSCVDVSAPPDQTLPIDLSTR